MYKVLENYLNSALSYYGRKIKYLNGIFLHDKNHFKDHFFTPEQINLKTANNQLLVYQVDYMHSSDIQFQKNDIIKKLQTTNFVKVFFNCTQKHEVMMDFLEGVLTFFSPLILGEKTHTCFDFKASNFSKG